MIISSNINLLDDLENELWNSKDVIYCYTNKINGKRYIGKTNKSLKNRHKGHMKAVKYSGNVSHKQYIHKAIRKYGIENFTLEILHIADEYSIDMLERHYIYCLNTFAKNGTGYNIASGGSDAKTTVGKTDEELKEWKKKLSEITSGENNPFYGKKHTEETKLLISKANSGRKHTEEAKRKMSEQRKGEKHYFYGKKHTEETKRKIGEANRGEKSPFYGKKRPEFSESMKGKNNHKARKVVQINSLTDEVIKVWDYMKQVEEELNIGRRGIGACCRGIQKTAGGYKWKYYEDVFPMTYEQLEGDKE